MPGTIDKISDFIIKLSPEPVKRTVVPPIINQEKCTGCGLCAKDCTFIIKMIDDKAHSSTSGTPVECVGCGHCVAICPVGAIKDPLAEKGDNRAYKASSRPTPASLQLLFQSRRTMRNYKDKPVPREALEKIINAARFAPTGGNKPHDINYLVLSSAEEIAKLRGPVLASILKLASKLRKKSVQAGLSLVMGRENVETVVGYIPILEAFRDRWEKDKDDRIFYKAPALIVVHGKKGDDTVGFGCAIALHQAVLMSELLNIGTCYNGLFQQAINLDKTIKEMVGIPKSHKCYGTMTLGYSAVKYQRLVRRTPSPVVWR